MRMGIWNWLFGGDIAPATSDNAMVVAPMNINPATGLPMIDPYGGVDVGGSPYGVDCHADFSASASVFDNGFEMGSGTGTDWHD